MKKPRVICKECGEEFYTLKDYVLHMQKNHAFGEVKFYQPPR